MSSSTTPGLVVLIPDRLTPPADVERAVFGDTAEILLCGTGDAARIAPEQWARADAVLAWHEIELPAAVLETLSRCRVIVRVGAGCDNVDLRAAGRLGIPVCNVPDYGTTDVADHALALALTLARGVPAFNRAVRRGGAGDWAWTVAGSLRRIAGSTMGVVGLGRIGTAAALRARAFGMRVLFFDPYVPDGRDKSLGIERVESLAALAAAADVVTFHVPLTSETRAMAGDDFFGAAKRGLIVVNTSRGPVVSLDALERALRTEGVRAAGLDVVESEPPDQGHPLIRAWRAEEPWIRDRLVITPHAAFFCEEAYRELRHKAAIEAQRVLSGLSPRNCVNREWLTRSR